MLGGHGGLQAAPRVEGGGEPGLVVRRGRHRLGLGDEGPRVGRGVGLEARQRDEGPDPRGPPAVPHEDLEGAERARVVALTEELEEHLHPVAVALPALRQELGGCGHCHVAVLKELCQRWATHHAIAAMPVLDGLECCVHPRDDLRRRRRRGHRSRGGGSRGRGEGTGRAPGGWGARSGREGQEGSEGEEAFKARHGRIRRGR